MPTHKFLPGDVVSVEVGFMDTMMAVVLEPAHVTTEKIRILTEDGKLDEAPGKAMVLAGVNVLRAFSKP